jgi:hypothetical protein
MKEESKRITDNKDEPLSLESSARTVAALVRRESKAGRLTPESVIWRLLSDRSTGLLQRKELEGILDKALQENEDLNALAIEDGSRNYYSSLFMTEAYADLLVNKRDPVRLIADVVRRNSLDYPRPVPLDMFMQSPFEFSGEDLPVFLERLTADPSFQDIMLIRTPGARIFLFSSRHLEPEHASLLVRWIETDCRDFP